MASIGSSIARLAARLGLTGGRRRDPMDPALSRHLDEVNEELGSFISLALPPSEPEALVRTTRFVRPLAHRA